MHAHGDVHAALTPAQAPVPAIGVPAYSGEPTLTLTLAS